MKDKNLKTLEDLENYLFASRYPILISTSSPLIPNLSFSENDTKLVIVEKLREEIKKWLEALEDNPEEWACSDNCPNVCDSLSEWIKYFFNIDKK